MGKHAGGSTEAVGILRMRSSKREALAASFTLFRCDHGYSVFSLFLQTTVDNDFVADMLVANIPSAHFEND